MPEPSESLVTIGEIAAAARHLAKDPYTFAERCRHWARLGLLQAVEQVGEGSGRHALYRRTESYMAAVVTALAETGLQPAGSRAVADAQSVARLALADWLGQRAKGRPKPMLLAIYFFPRGGWGIEVHQGARRKWTAEEAASLKARGSAATGPAMTTITVNLGELFASVFEAAGSNR